MRQYRLRIVDEGEAITERLFALGYRKISGRDEWLREAESKQQVRAEIGRVILGSGWRFTSGLAHTC